MGTTSACAENTAADCCSRRGSRNYLRVRGEYNSWSRGCSRKRELPPRAQRILFGTVISIHSMGTTSACAENTIPRPVNYHRFWNYLRVRGEYAERPWAASLMPELPPRARRIHFFTLTEKEQGGTTSACAENTPGGDAGTAAIRNYLRVRGEYLAAGIAPFPRKELPPRARRIPP